MRVFAALLVVFLAAVPGTTLFAEEDAESHITLPLSYDEETDAYYFSGISEYCAPRLPLLDTLMARVEWYSS